MLFSIVCLFVLCGYIVYRQYILTLTIKNIREMIKEQMLIMAHGQNTQDRYSKENEDYLENLVRDLPKKKKG